MKYIQNQKGFTLMEVLFVALVIATIVAFALPAIRSARVDAQNARAKAALKKLAEARRTYYQNTRGGTFSFSYFNATNIDDWVSASCSVSASSGVPGKAIVQDSAQDLFACGLLNRKDFINLPYQFYICPGDRSGPCDEKKFVMATATPGAGITKYEPPYYMYASTRDMEVYDTNNPDW